MATRTPDANVATLPKVPIMGLRHADTRTLLDTVLTATVDERVRDQIVTETAGNPLALLELPRGLGTYQLAGDYLAPRRCRR